MQDQDNLENKVSPQTTDTHYLQNQLLIAMPGLEDPYFKQSVTLICQHSEHGCFGITINKPIPVTVDEVLKQLKLDAEDESSIEHNHPENKNFALGKPALRGGPVQAEQGFIIHDSNQQWSNTFYIWVKRILIICFLEQ